MVVKGIEQDDKLREMILEYAAVLNAREGYGWIPALWVDGRRLGSTYYTHGVDQDQALEYALRDAQAEADCYVGDWDIEIKER